MYLPRYVVRYHEKALNRYLPILSLLFQREPNFHNYSLCVNLLFTVFTYTDLKTKKYL